MNKANGCTVTSYSSNGRSKHIKDTKIKPRIYMVIVIIIVTIITLTKVTLMKTATKTVIRIMI